MPDINSVIDTLSDEELDLLNNDPEMLAQFKAKYTAPTAAPAPMAPAAPEEKGMFGKAMDVLGTPGRGVAALSYGAGQMAPLVVGQQPLSSPQNTLQTMSEMTKPGFQPQNLDQRAADVAGTMTNLAVPVGEALTLGGQAIKATGIAPKVAAITKGLFSGTQKAGKGIAATEEAAKIITDKVVSIPKGGQGLTKALQDIKDTGDLVKSGLKQETPEFLQQLKDYHDKAAGILDQGPKAIGKKNYALASQAKAAINEALNSMVPGRDTAQLTARTAYLRNNLLKKGIILGGVGAAASYGKNAILGALKDN